MGHDSAKDELREKSEINLVQDLKKSITHARFCARRVATDIHSEISKLNIFEPARLHKGESKIVTIRDRSKKSYQFVADCDGRDWGVFGYSIHPCLNFINSVYKTETDFQTGVERALITNKKHLSFHKKLIDIHPIIGTSILLGRSALSRAKTAEPEMLERIGYEQTHPSVWFESHMTLAERSLHSIESTFSLLKERTTDTLTQSFLHDVQQECELLIAECCFFSFLILDYVVLLMSRKAQIMPCTLKESPFPISSSEYALREKDILRLRSAYMEYVNERLDTVFPMPDVRRIAETGEIHLPVYVSISDIESIVSTYAQFWDQLATALAHGAAHPLQHGRTRIINDLEIGIGHGSLDSEDRLSFRLPHFNIRIDKDVRHEVITLDIGGASLKHVLSCAEEFLSTIFIDKKMPSVFQKETSGDDQNVILENKMALLASVMMHASYPIGLRKKPTISHHSREFVAKDEYYHNFSHILDCIKEGLERPQHHVE